MGKLIVGIIAFLIGLFLFLRYYKQRKRIDTKSIAVVKVIHDLGRSSSGRLYAIRYQVQASEPFELLVTPTKKAYPIGKQRLLYYEKGDPQHNYYFKTLFALDKRFFAPIFLLGGGVATIVVSFLQLIGVYK